MRWFSQPSRQLGAGVVAVLSVFAPNVTAGIWEGGASLRRVQDGEHGGCTTEMEQSAAIGGDVLVVAGADSGETTR